ncbi:hypothetical protein AAF712_011019 [Marasmius tenuissimus]|uniref:F-box domain-containing protein n=1 Tax=Marasmius tenuissimus TaxID=585030 RepID=A0ABR2ZLQ1_9AGAR
MADFMADFVDATAMERVPLEVWEQIAFMLPCCDLWAVHKTCRKFRSASVRPRRGAMHWKSTAAVERHREIVWDALPPNDSLRLAIRSVVLGRPPKRGDEAMDMVKWSSACPVIDTFTNLTSLSIYFSDFPLHDLFDIMLRLPRLEILDLRMLVRDIRTFLSSPASPCSLSRETLLALPLRELTLRDIPGGPIQRDAGYSALLDVVCYSSIQTLSMGAVTFTSLLDALFVTKRALSPSLLALHVREGFMHCPEWDLVARVYYADAICNALSKCSATLEKLSLWTNGRVGLANEELYLPSLTEYVGPHDFLQGIKFLPSIRTIWVPTPNCTSNVEL